MKKSGLKVCISPLLILILCCSAVFAVASDYQIGSGDVVRINVYDHPDLATTARVDSDGYILFPLAGKLRLGGLTTVQASEAVAMKLDKDYIINPQVTVFVEEFRSKKVVVMGEVVRPGLYELSGPTNIVELISKAGGLTNGAGQSATIRRANSSESREKTLTVNLTEILETGIESEAVQLKDGDTLTVAKAGVVYVTGQVRRPAAYVLEPDATVIKAITLAGGFTELASESNVKIIRMVNGHEQVMEKVPLHEKLMANDVMVVPESFF